MAWFWQTSEDHQFMLDIFAEIDRGGFGPLDNGRLYATGISSGGYMTSRMDVSYRSRFRALAIHSASYATCGGFLCVLPDDLNSGHLPTLFMHGDADPIVPIATMLSYRDELDNLGVDTETIVAPGVGHAWIDASPQALVDWFGSHP